MRKTNVLITILLTMLVSFAGISAGADNVIIDTSGATPFLYEGRSYLPLRSVGSFLGAHLGWDEAKGQAVISYNGQDLALTPGNANASFQGQPVVLSSPPVTVQGRTYVPTDTFRKFYNVPVVWYGAQSQVKVKGPGGWGTVQVNSRPPWHGGPPPWAPAWGERRQQERINHLAPGNQDQRQNDGKQKGKAKVK